MLVIKAEERGEMLIQSLRLLANEQYIYIATTTTTIHYNAIYDVETMVNKALCYTPQCKKHQF